MKIKRVTNPKNSLIKLKLLQTKSYKKIYQFESLKIEDILYRLVKSFRILSKYNVSNKKILFFNNSLVIHTKLRNVVQKTRHSYKINGLPHKNNAKAKNNLLVALNGPVNQNFLSGSSKVKTPCIFIMDSFKSFNHPQTYLILGSFLHKQSENFFFFVLLISLLKRTVTKNYK